jgi:hypothetical protein
MVDHADQPAAIVHRYTVGIAVATPPDVEVIEVRIGALMALVTLTIAADPGHDDLLVLTNIRERGDQGMGHPLQANRCPATMGTDSSA